MLLNLLLFAVDVNMDKGSGRPKTECIGDHTT